jgi:hypothetical protein
MFGWLAEVCFQACTGGPLGAKNGTGHGFWPFEMEHVCLLWDEVSVVLLQGYMETEILMCSS